MRTIFIKKTVIFLLFFVLCFVVFITYFRNFEVPNTFNYDVDLVNRCVQSINHGLDFFFVVEDLDLIFDMLIGIRIVMEQAWLISVYLTRKDGLSSLLETLNELITKSNEIFAKVFDALMRTQVDNMNRKNEYMFRTNNTLIKTILVIGHIISPNSWSHWTVDSLCVNASLRYKHLHLTSRDEENNKVYAALNKCLKQYEHKCLIDDRCWDIMTEYGGEDYELSHQLMYIMLAETYGCNERINYHIKRSGQVSQRNLQTIFCSNMYNETFRFDELAKDNFMYRDIVMESVAFCGILGFHQFTNNKEWTRNIIRWQHKTECWPYQQFPDEHQHTHSRRKRSENVVGPSNCSLHMTTVAVGALIVNIKNDIIQLFEPSISNC